MLGRSILVRMCPKIGIFSLLALALLSVAPNRCAAQEQGSIRFNQFPVETYRGHIKIPREFHKVQDGLWEDEAGKPAVQPRVNFAGEYFLAAHSCGTCCRYYTLSDLRTGSEVDQVSMFNAGEPTPVTRDGHTYIPILFFKPDSRLLVVQYVLDLCTPVKHNPCRQRYFVLEGGHFRAISKTLRSCTHEGGEPE
jgi:hypothetical protein